MKSFITNTLNHLSIYVYSIIFVFLCVGVFSISNFKFFPSLLLFFIVLIIAYTLLVRFKPLQNQTLQFLKNFSVPENTQKMVIYFLIIITPIFIVYHWYVLGGIPTIRGYGSHNSFYIYQLRNSVTKAGTFVNYMYSFETKAILPFLIMYLYKTKSKLFYPILIIGSAYGLSLVMKSIIISILLPVGIYCVFDRKFVTAAIVLLITVLGLFMLTFCANPALRGGDTYQPNGKNIEMQQPTSVFTSANNSFKGLKNRVIYIPGKTVAYWFLCIPKHAPFLHGDGYKPLAKIKGRPFHDYSTELYQYVYPTWYAQGFRGTVNCASFMYDYANFGNWGMVLSGMVLAILFYAMYLLNRYNLAASTSMNVIHYLMISSSSLTTMMLSGGWGLFLALFMLTKDKFEEKVEA